MQIQSASTLWLIALIAAHTARRPSHAICRPASTTRSWPPPYGTRRRLPLEDARCSLLHRVGWGPLQYRPHAGLRGPKPFQYSWYRACGRKLLLIARCSRETSPAGFEIRHSESKCKQPFLFSSVRVVPELALIPQDSHAWTANLSAGNHRLGTTCAQDAEA
eukprot:3214134-Rhodomonas_salina.1